MINKLYLEGFKAFYGDAQIDLAPITVLAGKNSSGKSSITGALAALIQTEEAGYHPEAGLNTQGPWARLGRAADVPHKLRRGDAARRFAVGLELPGEMQQPNGTKMPYIATLRLEYEAEERVATPYLAALERATVIVQQPTATTSDVLRIESERPAAGVPRKYLARWQGRNEGPREIPLRGNCRVGVGEALATTNSGLLAVAAFNPDLFYELQAPDLSGKLFNVVLDKIKTSIKHAMDTIQPTDLLQKTVAELFAIAPEKLDHMYAELNKELGPYYIDKARGAMVKGQHVILAAHALQTMHTALDPRRHQILSAYRIPPMDLYVPRPEFGPRLGLFGEHIGQAIDELRESDSDLPGPHPGASGPRRGLALLNEWWAYLFDLPTLRIESQSIARLGHELSVATPEAENLKLYQVGAGLSQTLPIVAAVVLSKAGEQLVIDTPESHLHPAAQHRLAELLVAAAAAGRRILIETHSDHLVNGLCLAVKRKQLPPDDLRIHFVSREEQGSVVQQVPVNGDGRVSEWPPGFMDQSAQDLTALLGS